MINFKRYNDPLLSLGIGKKSLIENWLKEKNINHYTINEDLSLNIYEAMFWDDYIDSPEYIQFNENPKTIIIRTNGKLARSKNNKYYLKM